MRLKLHVVVLILNDNCYGMIKWKQEGMEFAEYGLSLNNPDFVKYAEAYDAHGHRITQVHSIPFTMLGLCVSMHHVCCHVSFSRRACLLATISLLVHEQRDESILALLSEITVLH